MFVDINSFQCLLNLALDQLLVFRFLGMDQLPVFRSVYLLFNLIIFPSSPILFWIFPTSHFFLSFASLWEENYEFAGQFWILATGLKVCGRKLLEESSSEPASQNFFKLSFSNYLLSRPPRTLAFIQFSHIQRLHRIREPVIYVLAEFVR